MKCFTHDRGCYAVAPPVSTDTTIVRRGAASVLPKVLVQASGAGTMPVQSLSWRSMKIRAEAQQVPESSAAPTEPMHMAMRSPTGAAMPDVQARQHVSHERRVSWCMPEPSGVELNPMPSCILTGPDGEMTAMHRRASRDEPMIPLIHSNAEIAGHRYAMGWWRLDRPASYTRCMPLDFGVPGNGDGLPYINATGMAEECSLRDVYRVEPRWAGGKYDPRIQGFEPDMILAGSGHLVQDRYLFTLENRVEAIRFGEQRYGIGNFSLYHINALGLPVVRYRRHVESSLGARANSFNPAARRGDAYLDIRGLERDMIDLIPMLPATVGDR